jgi:hypothetical protein
LETIKSAPQKLIYSPLVEEEAFYRLRNYPAQIHDSLHHALAKIPRKLAYVLHACPASISYAVDTFYLRDPVGLKALQRQPESLIFAPNDLVTVSIKFTKVLYAQIKSQQFDPPAAWKTIMIEAERVAATSSEKQKELAQLEVGMKVTSGFEMLLSDPANKDNRTYRELQIIVEDLNEDLEAGILDALSTDDTIRAWPNSSKEDDESWLDINFEDFEKELDGKKGSRKADGSAGAFGPDPVSGFGDAKTQADLRKIVERFEAFMNDENAGIDGADLDEMDYDDDEEESDDSSEDEDRDVSFDEKEFARMMREMMGMPPEVAEDTPGNQTQTSGIVEELDSDEDEEGINEAEEIRKITERMEAELNAAGAFNLDSASKKITSSDALGKSRDLRNQEEHTKKQDWESDSDGEIDIDFNLANNLLESFKSQAGMAGPGGNLMGMMGLQLPRDEDDAQPPQLKEQDE